ncbi:unnamed protein product [Gemmata massiliana]|uniref:Uncharacterized protein n=1 Tax=Gemmata massiliana TaxID=1210884 RepID=A0A6P2DG48_9BACT|nr:unnamed protein product [Gemmata massiliana]
MPRGTVLAHQESVPEMAFADRLGGERRNSTGGQRGSVIDSLTGPPARGMLLRARRTL